jgi:hypothetical protein
MHIRTFVNLFIVQEATTVHALNLKISGKYVTLCKTKDPGCGSAFPIRI